MTRKLIICFILILEFFPIFGQQYEFGFNIGAGNYIGDIGNESYFTHNKIGGGILFKNTINPWFSFRLNVNYQPIYTTDLKANSLGRQKRDLAANANLWDFSTGIEYNFLPRNPFLHSIHGQRLTPYMYSGIGVGTFQGNIYKNTNKQENGNYNGSGFFIPMTLGIKYKINTHLIVSIETNAKYYFTDNLDGTVAYYNPEKLDGPNTSLVVNPNSNDWYTYTSFSLIYSFGDLLCYFNLK